MRTLERAGADCIQFEDQVAPKRCGHFSGKDVISTEEAVAKIKAAVDARQDAQLMIMARTDASAAQGFEAAVERAQRFAEAGADILFVEAVTVVGASGALPDPSTVAPGSRVSSRRPAERSRGSLRRSWPR